MTMIVGIKCGDAAVLCADSQATYGDQKTEVDKLAIAPFPKGEVVIGGAGDEALTKALATSVVDALSRPFESAHAVVQKGVAAFHKSDVFKAYPRSPKEKRLAGLIGLRFADGVVLLFEYALSVVTPVTTYKLAGEEIPPYEITARRLYRSNLSIDEAAVLGIDIVEAAKETSIYVGGTTRVVSLQPTGVVIEDAAKIYNTALHVAETSRLMGILRLQAADQTTPEDLFQKNLDAFCNSMTTVRNLYGSRVPAWPDITIRRPFETDDED